MNPLITILLATAFGLSGLLVVAGGLIHASWRRRRAVLLGGPDFSSRLLDDLKPVEGLLVEFVRHSPEMGEILSVLTSADQPYSFTRIVHEIRIVRRTPINLSVAAHKVAVGLGVLLVAGLVRVRREGFVAMPTGHEVRRRLEHAPFTLQFTKSLPIHNVQTKMKEETQSMNNRNIIMTAADHTDLSAVIAYSGKVSDRAKFEMRLLENELKRADIVAPDELPPDVITMNSRAELLDLESKERMEFTLVLPQDANIDDGKISVLAPLGTAMLGYRVGDEFQWHVPFGIRRLKVLSVFFQPEAELKKAA